MSLSGGAVIDAVVRWAEYCAKHPAVLEAAVLSLRRPSGVVDVDAHHALLADFLQGVADYLKENPT